MAVLGARKREWLMESLRVVAGLGLALARVGRISYARWSSPES
jgi:hypothetical protein